jgi:hypothetical protein
MTPTADTNDLSERARAAVDQFIASVHPKCGPGLYRIAMIEAFKSAL